MRKEMPSRNGAIAKPTMMIQQHGTLSVILAASLLLSGGSSSSHTVKAIELNSLNQQIYDYDASWAVKTTHLSNQLGDKQRFYDSFIESCKRSSKSPERAEDACVDGENYRLKMNNFQPISMRNYTKMGFKKIKAPVDAFKVIKDFWDEHRYENKTEWHSINTYHNMWESPSMVVNIQDESVGGGEEVIAPIWNAVRDVLEEWTGFRLSPCSMWGIRIYHNDSILTPHVDRNPLVTSAIINVDQDVDEPWPLEVWGHDGKPYNITMEPGDMVLYESHTILHGRPFPMKGRFFANIFVHFEPLGTYRMKPGETVLDVQYDEDALESLDAGLPPYLIPGSPWDEEWRNEYTDGWELEHSDLTRGVLDNDIRMVEDLYIHNPERIHEVDENGWGPLHEAARSGHVDMAQFLHQLGVDLTLETSEGQTALELAEVHHGEDSDIYKFLFNAGAGEF